MDSRRSSLSQRNDVGRLETHQLRHARRMLIPQMPINFHRQSAAVLVSKPARNGRNVHAAFNAACRKQMAQIVVGQMSNANFLFRAFHCQFAFGHARNASGRRFVRAFSTQFFQKLAHFCNHGDSANFTVLRALRSGRREQ